MSVQTTWDHRNWKDNDESYPTKNIKAKFSSTMSRLLLVLSICFQYFLYDFSTFSTRCSAALILHYNVSVYLTIVECEVSTFSTAGIKFIDTPFRYRAEVKSTVSNIAGPAMQLNTLRWDNFRTYRHIKSTVYNTLVSTTQLYALCWDNFCTYGRIKSTVYNTVGPATQLYALYWDNFRTYGRIAYPNRHVRYHVFTWHTLGSHYFHSYICPVLATCSGAAPRIGIPSPDVGNRSGVVKGFAA
jgi:hypothetical protein